MRCALGGGRANVRRYAVIDGGTEIETLVIGTPVRRAVDLCSVDVLLGMAIETTRTFNARLFDTAVAGGAVAIILAAVFAASIAAYVRRARRRLLNDATALPTAETQGLLVVGTTRIANLGLRRKAADRRGESITSAPAGLPGFVTWRSNAVWNACYRYASAEIGGHIAGFTLSGAGRVAAVTVDTVSRRTMFA